MAINIKGTKPPQSQVNLDDIGEGQAEAQTPPATDPAAPPATNGEAQAPLSQQAAPPNTGAVPNPNHQTSASYLVTGSAQQSQVQQVKAAQDLRSKLRTGVREFWLDPGQFAKGVFLDGALLNDGVFDTPMIAIHMLQIGGSWSRFVCTKHTEGQCIVCDSNADGSQPTTLQLFTFVNVMPYVIQNGPNKGKTLNARLQLFAATLKVREMLVKRAQNHGNTLAGGLYQFSRSTKQDPRTGNDIEFIQNVDLGAVIAKYPKLGSRQNAKGEWEDAPTTVINYATAYPVLTNAEIAALRPDIASMAGFTNFTPAGGNAGGGGGGFGADPTGAMDDDLPF